MSKSPPSKATPVSFLVIPGETPPAPRFEALLLSRLGTRARRPPAHLQGTSAGERNREQWGSAVAALVATNELLGRPASLDVLLDCAMAGEIAGCGSAHPDNVAPALYGGFVLARTSQPADLVRLPVPDGLSCAVLHPHLMIETGSARRLLGESVPLISRGPAMGERGCPGGWACSETTLPLIVARARRPCRGASARAPGAGARLGEARGDRPPGRLAAACRVPARPFLRSCESLERAKAAGRAMREAFAGASDVPRTCGSLPWALAAPGL